MPDAPGLNNWIKLIILGMIWGASFMFVTIALESFGPMTIAAGRISLGAVLMLCILRLCNTQLPRLSQENGGKIWVAAIAMGFLSNALPFSLLSWAQTYVASGFAGVCMAVVPLFILPLAHFFVPGEALNLRKSIGFLIGFVGVVVLIGIDALASVGGSLEPYARLACIAAASCYAIGSIITRLCPQVDLVALSAAALLTGSIMILPVALWHEGVPDTPDLIPLLAILYLGTLPTAAAQLLLVQVIKSAGPSFMSLVNYQVPVWSVIFGALLLSEALPPQLVISLVLILGGLALSKRRRPSQPIR